MEPVKKSVAGKSPERVILGDEESLLVSKWTAQLNTRSEGLVRFTKADVVNFILRRHRAEFSAEEAQAISLYCFDETRWLAWAMERLRAAKKRGESLTLEDLMKFRVELMDGSRALRKKNVDKNPSLATPERGQE